MEGNIVFYIYDKFIELNGRQFSAGELTADFLNLSPEVYRPMHERMARICQLEESFSKSRDLAQWWELNNEMETLCNELRRHTVFKLLLGEGEDRFFSVVREITGQFNLFPMVEEGAPSEEELKAIRSAAEKFFMLNEVDPTPEQDIPREPFDLFHPRAVDEEKGDDFFYEIYRAIGPTEGAWERYRKHIARYRTYLHDIRAFNGTIWNFIKFGLSQLKHNNPENYAEVLYGFYNDDRVAEKLIINPIHNGGDCYKTYDDYTLSYVPRVLPNGKAAICQEHVTDSVQALLKADYMLALNSGYNVRRCIVCQKYFLAKSGAHILYCEGRSPFAPRFTCRQYGSTKIQKELAKDNPKIAAKNRAFDRIDQDRKRGNISRDDARKAKAHVSDLLYDALRTADFSVEELERKLESDNLYPACGVRRLKKPRGRPKVKDGDGA